MGNGQKREVQEGDIRPPDRFQTQIRMQNVNLSEKLWMSTEETRQNIMQTNFIQKIKDGTLDVEKFGQFMIQDMAYCYTLTGKFEIIIRRAQGDMKTFLTGKLEEHVGYCQDMFAKWGLEVQGVVEHIVLKEACQEYIDFWDEIARSEDPIYFCVAFLPCSRGWAWIGEQLQGNLADLRSYQSWVTENFADFGYGDWEGVVNKSTTVNPERAQEIYARGMLHEYQFFNSFSP